jgi:hypothetical protein
VLSFNQAARFGLADIGEILSTSRGMRKWLKRPKMQKLASSRLDKRHATTYLRHWMWAPTSNVWYPTKEEHGQAGLRGASRHLS